MVKVSGAAGLAVAGLLVMGLLLPGAAPWRRAEAPPRLVVWVVVDQGRGDAVDRLDGHQVRGGFSRFRDDGAWFTDARFQHLSTWTSSGHATLVSGAYPDRHGIMANTWFEDGRRVKVSEDQGAGPGPLRVTTVGDELHLRHAGAKVVALSLKDRAASLSGGWRPDGAYWFDTKTGAFVGDGPGEGVAPWVEAFNTPRPADAAFGTTWTTTLPEETLAREATPDDCAHETDSYGLGRVFPHRIDGGLQAPGPDYYKALLRSPAGTAFLFDFARAALDGEALGQDDVPDVLFISVSSTDYAGHFFGLQSRESLELLTHLDQELARFLKEAEAHVGRGRLGVVLSADHGGAPVPECVTGQVESGRVPVEAVSAAVEATLVARFGPRDEAGAPWVVAFDPPGLYLDLRPDVDAAEARRLATQAIRAVPGILDVCDATAPAGPYADACRRSIVPGRAPDLLLISRPYWVFSEAKYKDLGTTHGSPHTYDTRVLLGLWGPGIHAGVHDGQVDVARIAPTVARWLGTNPPAASEGGALDVFGE